MSRWAAALRLIGVGWWVALWVIAGAMGGLWLDGRFDTSPILAIIGILLGVAIAGYGVYRMLIPAMERDKDKGDR